MTIPTVDSPEPARPTPVGKGSSIRRRLQDFGRPPRLMGIDVARGIAVFGMIGAHVGTTPELAWGDPSTWAALVHGRSSILFALVAGISIALATGARTRPAGEALRSARLRMAGRALAVFAVGLFLEMLGTYVAVILTLYGVLFLIAIGFLGMTRRALLIIAAVITLIGPAVVALISALTLGGTGPGVELVLGGSYPATVWLPLMLTGMALGRSDLASPMLAALILSSGVLLAATGYTIGNAVNDETSSYGSSFISYDDDSLYDDEPSYADSFTMNGGFEEVIPKATAVAEHSGGTFEIIGSGGFALAVVGLCLLVAPRLRWACIPIAAVGSMPLTSYSTHVFSLALLWSPFALAPGLVENAALGGNLFWLISVGVLMIACTAWALLLGRGPLERLTAWSARRFDQA